MNLIKFYLTHGKSYKRTIFLDLNYYRILKLRLVDNKPHALQNIVICPTRNLGYAKPRNAVAVGLSGCLCLETSWCDPIEGTWLGILGPMDSFPGLTNGD